MLILIKVKKQKNEREKVGEIEAGSLEFLFDRDIDPTSFEVRVLDPSQFFKDSKLYIKVSSKGQFVQHYFSQLISAFHEGQIINLKNPYVEASLLSFEKLPSTVTVHLLTRNGKKEKQGIFPFWGSTKLDTPDDPSATDDDNIVKYRKDAKINGLANFNFEGFDGDGKIIFNVIPEINTDRIGEPGAFLFTQFILNELCTYLLLSMQETDVYQYAEIMEDNPQSSCLYTIARYLSDSGFPEPDRDKNQDPVKDALKWKADVLNHYWKLNAVKLQEWREKANN